MVKNNIFLSSPGKWILFSGLCLFLIYDFIQFSVLNTLSQQIIDEFSLSHFSYGVIASINLYVDFLFIIPASLLVDRISPKKLILYIVLISLVTTLAFILKRDLFTLILWRVGVGIVCSASFSGSIKVSAFLFDKKLLGLTSGLILASVMVGDVLSQAPVLYLLNAFNLQTVLILIFVFGLLAFAALMLLPSQMSTPGTSDIFANIKETFLNRTNWYAVLFACFMTFSLVILGAIWGQIFLTKYYGLTSMQASLSTTLMFVGNLMGAPLVGFWSDKIEKRGIFMFSCAILTALTLAILVIYKDITVAGVYTIFYIIGFLSSSQSLCYASLVSNSKSHHIATSISMISTMLLGSIIVFEYIFSYLLSNNISNMTLIIVGLLAMMFSYLFLKKENKLRTVGVQYVDDLR